MDEIKALNKLEDTIMIWAFHACGSIVSEWSKSTGKDLTSNQDFAIRSEVLWFFLQMMERWTCEIRGREFTATLQDGMIPKVIRRLIETSFDRSRVKKDTNIKALDSSLADTALEHFNDAEIDYGSCTGLIGEQRGDYLHEESILGKLAARISRLTEEHSVEFRLLIWTTAAKFLAKSGLNKQIEETYQ